MPTLYECDLSIIIPVYNLEEHITPMLDSLKCQQLGDYTVEVIFVLNNCTDHSEDVIRSSGIECKILNCTTQGCGPARNAGIEKATGMYIWMMDGDDWLIGDTAIKDVLDKAYTRRHNILRIPFESDLFLYDYFSMVWQYLLKREFIQGIRFPNYQPGEDDAYMMVVLNKAGYNRTNYLQIPHTDKAYYYYNYMREGSNMYRCVVKHEEI